MKHTLKFASTKKNVIHVLYILGIKKLLNLTSQLYTNNIQTNLSLLMSLSLYIVIMLDNFSAKLLKKRLHPFKHLQKQVGFSSG